MSPATLQQRGAAEKRPFELLMACIISMRTRDEVTLPCARRLFVFARTPSTLNQLTPEAIDEAISTSTFHDAKARQMHDIASRLPTAHGGALRCPHGSVVAAEALKIAAYS